MDANHQARKRAKRKFLLGLPSDHLVARRSLRRSRRLITERSDAKQKLLSERQTKYMEELALKHDLQQQEGRYIKAPCYLKAASEKEADRLYRQQAAEISGHDEGWNNC